MDNIIFSLGGFCLTDNNQVLNINKNTYIKTPDTILKLSDNLCPKNQIILDTKNVQSCSMYKASIINNIRFIEIINSGEKVLKNKYITKNCEINIFENHVLIVYNGKVYSYYFDYYENTQAFEINGKAYIFNNKYFLIFDMGLLVFSHYFVVEINYKNLEILCRLPKNLNYYIYIKLNTINNSVFIKKLKKSGNDLAYLLPYKLFYLSKNNFQDVSVFVKNSIDCKNLFRYFNEYENIFNIDDKFYITRHDGIHSLTITIEDKYISDID